MHKVKFLLVAITAISVSVLAKENKIILSDAVDKSGYISEEWIEVRANREVFTTEHLSKKEKKLTAEEMTWAKLIASRVRTWQTQLDQIAIPFSSLEIPRELSIVIGNRGTDDAFVYGNKLDSKVYFNVNVMTREYGDGKNEVNKERIDRIFAHEYTHLLQKRRSIKTPYKMNSNLDRALIATYKEGFAHYRSISTKWKDNNGFITEHGEKALKYLENAFVERIISLKDATSDETKILMKDLSRGPFHKKWGALTVALWLTKESKGNDKKLVDWVDSGPQGILVLANKYLPEELRLKLNNELKSYREIS